MKTTFDRISGMTAEQRDKLAEQFEKASRVAGAEPIAVVGIGCRFPGGVTGPDSYWKLLESGTDAVTEVPADRWDAEAFYDTDPMAPGKMPTKWGAYLDDVVRFRRGLLRHHAARGRRDGSAAAGGPRGRLGGAGERRLAPDQLGEIPHRGDDGRLLHRVPERLGRQRRHHRRLLRDGQRAQRDRRPDRLPARPQGPGGGRRHRVLVVAGVHPPGLPEPADARERPRAGRWRQPQPAPGNPTGACQMGHALAARQVLRVRLARRRFRARRRCGRRGAQAADRRGARRGPGARRGAWLRGQPGRPLQRPDRAERAVPARRDHPRAALGRRRRRNR